MMPAIRFQHGFSLIGTLMGLLVGLMVAASALGTAAYMEAQKRAAMGGNSALANGAFGIFRIESETKLAGLGLLMRKSIACPAMNLSYRGTVLLDGAPLYPSEIADGAAASDTLSIAYLDSLLSAAPAQVLIAMADSADSIKVANAPDTQAGRFALLQGALPGLPCTLFQITSVTVSSFGQDLAHVGGDYNGGAFTTPVAYPENSQAAISTGLRWITFRINNNMLEEVDNITGAVLLVASDIIAMKVQYGVTDGVSTSISNWTGATGLYAAPSMQAMQNVRAIRVGLLARSPDKNTTCAASDAAPRLWPDGPSFDVTGNPQWQCYRYRIFNIVIPLLNVALGTR
jgi:type IV pilus assembly protein PilW